MARVLRVGVYATAWRCIQIHCDIAWMRRVGVGGMVVGRRVFFAKPADQINPQLLRHELEHVYQQIREGVVIFYLKYFWYSLRYGYKDNPFEVEAHERQHDPLTQTEEQLLWKLREGSIKSRVA